MKCSECYREAEVKGLCRLHYKRLWRHGDANISKAKKKVDVVKCSVENCNNLASFNNGLCKKHNHRLYLTGRLHTLNREHRSGTISNQGYVKVGRKGIGEHRILAEKALGRPLPAGAVVHHTGKPWDNHGPFKLVICPSAEYHSLIHKRMGELKWQQ